MNYLMIDLTDLMIKSVLLFVLCEKIKRLRKAEENRDLQEGRWLRVFDRYLFKEDTDDESFIEMIWYRFFIVFHNDELKLYKQTVIC